MKDREPPETPADGNVSPYLLRPTRSLRQVMEQRRRQQEVIARQAHDQGSQPADPAVITRSELAALIDLGLSDGAISAYLLMDPEGVARLRRAHHPGEGENIREGASIQELLALDRMSVAEMRHHARVLIVDSRRTTNPYQRAGLAEHAFELAQLAEIAERYSTRVTASPEDQGQSILALLRNGAADWQMRSTACRDAAKTAQNPMMRDAYHLLARSYGALAVEFEAQAGLYARKPDR